MNIDAPAATSQRDEGLMQDESQEGAAPVDDRMEDIIHETAEEDRDIEMGQNDGPCLSTETASPTTDTDMDMIAEVTPQVNHLIHTTFLLVDDDMPDVVAESSTSAATNDVAASEETEYLPESQSLAIEASTNVECTMIDAPIPSGSRTLAPVINNVGPSHERPKQRSKPAPGPNQRVIFSLDTYHGQCYRLIQCPAAKEDGCLGQGAGAKRKWAGGDGGRQTSLCTLEDLRRTFDCLVQRRHASLNGIASLITALEAPLYRPAFEFERPTNGAIRTFAGQTWKSTRVTTFSDFLNARALRRSGRKPLSLPDGVALIREYLIYRLPVVASTHGVLCHLERCSSAILEQIVGGSSALASTQERRMAGLEKQPNAKAFDRAFATPLYHQIQERLSVWMTSFAPARMGRVHVGAMQQWANRVRERCRRTKLGQTQDVWRFTDAGGQVVLAWGPKDPPKSTQEAQLWFLGWLDHVVAPTLPAIGAEAGLQAQYLVGLRQQLEDEIERWMEDFAQEARVGPQAVGAGRDAVQSIIAACSRR